MAICIAQPLRHFTKRVCSLIKTDGTIEQLLMNCLFDSVIV